VPDNKTGFLKYVSIKRRSNENVRTILVKDGHLRNRDEEKAEAISVFFAAVFNNTNRPWAAWSSESEDHKYGTFHFQTLKLKGSSCIS